MLRALEIDCGSPPLVDHYPTEKATTIALKEIALGKVVLRTNQLKQKKVLPVFTDAVPVLVEWPVFALVRPIGRKTFVWEICRLHPPFLVKRACERMEKTIVWLKEERQ